MVLDRLNCNVISINEHWLCEDESMLYIPAGYSLATIYCRKPPLTNGGCCIFVKVGIDYKVIDVVNYCVERVFEVTAIYLESVKSVVLSIYRTPDTDVQMFFYSFDALLKVLVKKYNATIIIAGDLNIDINKNTTKSDFFLNLLRSYNLYCLNKESSRKNACLDNIITNELREKTNCRVFEPHLSDHASVIATFNSKVLITKDKEFVYRNIRNVKPCAMAQFKSNLELLDWNVLSLFNNVETAFSYFIKKISHVYNDCCRVKEIKVKLLKREQKTRWFTPELKKLRELVIVLYNRFQNCKNDLEKYRFKNDYMLAKRDYRYKIRQAKIAANCNFIDNSNNKCKAAWKVIKGETYTNTKKGEEALINSKQLNDYFSNSAKILNNGNISNDDTYALQFLNKYLLSVPTDLNLSFRWHRITEIDVLNCVKNLSSSRSEDFYGFSNKIVKEIISLILEPLLYLYNLMLETGDFPSVLKVVKITPIYKKGDKYNPSSYRPISLVPILSKIFEHCIKNQLYKYMLKKGYICKEQFGFIPGRNTIKAVESVVTNVLNSLEEKLVCSASLIDLSKAFDCIPHQLLIEKLARYGIKNDELKLFLSYLNGRKQMVVQGKDKSDFSNVTIGVPQGSVLGPFLFVVAMNDFAYNMPCPSILYADDTTLLSSEKTIDNLLTGQKRILDAANEWFGSNSLVINKDKTEHIFFSLDVNIINVINCNHVKLLGIYLDSKLNWDVHVQMVCKKLARVIYLLRKLRCCVSMDLLMSAYYAFFHSQLMYGIVLWGNSRNAQKAFVWQKKALRIIKGLSDRESCQPFFKELHIMTLPSIYIYSCLVKCKETLEKRQLRHNIHTYPTRKNNKLEILRVRLEKTRKSYLCMETKLFNNLPETAWSVSLVKFKNSINTWLKDKAFYSIDDYLNSDTSEIKF